MDRWVAGLRARREGLAEYKRGVMQRLFSRELRFTRPDGTPFPDWQQKRLGDVLNYEQPTKYLVHSDDYDDDAPTPVLTAGKTFLLGRTREKFGIYEGPLPVIIFDDFTTATQLVDFPFKAKSSAMKLLGVKDPDDSIHVVFELMRLVDFPKGEHKRYWISEFQHELILMPHPEEQRKIAGFLGALDRRIDAVTARITTAEAFKRGLLQQMFV